MATILQATSLKHFLQWKSYYTQVVLSVFPNGPINNKAVSYLIMAWDRECDRTLCGSMPVYFLQNTSSTRPQCVNVKQSYSIFQNLGTTFFFLSCLADATRHIAMSCLVLLCLVCPQINHSHTCLSLLLYVSSLASINGIEWGHMKRPRQIREVAIKTIALSLDVVVFAWPEIINRKWNMGLNTQHWL